MTRVVFLVAGLTQYRARFHELVRDRLAQRGIDYVVMVTPPKASETEKGDQVALPFCVARRDLRLRLGHHEIIWQPVDGSTLTPDLLIVIQELRYLSNIALVGLRHVMGRKTAFFGHGRNFQAGNRDSLRERFKRFWATRIDWWFGYTELTADIVSGYGFPRERITVFNNAIDTSAIGRELAAIDPAEQERLRAELFAGSRNVGVYIGGIYAEKRIPFLLAAAEAIRAQVPDFHLLVIGGGPDAGLVKAAAERHEWIHYAGPRFGADKTLLASLARVQLMPGLVGLGVLDSFAYGTPMVTTAVPYHSPEIDYLENGRNGVIIADPEDIDGYTGAVVQILTDDAYRARLQEGAATALATYTVENMAQRFADGVVKALATR